jgi:hypothetical protein
MRLAAGRAATVAAERFRKVRRVRLVLMVISTQGKVMGRVTPASPQMRTREQDAEYSIPDK